jgi:hypothetical protein
LRTNEHIKSEMLDGNTGQVITWNVKTMKALAL